MRIELYCDGGCRGNHKRTNIGGWGVYLVFGEHEKELYGSARNTTNNVMELTAAIEGLRAIKNKDVGCDVYVDSSYVLNGITSWIEGWMRKGWKTAAGKPVANRDLWLALYEEKQKFSDLTFNKVKGHSTNAGNNRADALVNRAMGELGA